MCACMCRVFTLIEKGPNLSLITLRPTSTACLALWVIYSYTGADEPTGSLRSSRFDWLTAKQASTGPTHTHMCARTTHGLLSGGQFKQGPLTPHRSTQTPTRCHANTHKAIAWPRGVNSSYWVKIGKCHTEHRCVLWPKISVPAVYI